MNIKVINITLFVVISNIFCRETSGLQMCDDASSVDITKGTHLPNGNIHFDSKIHEYFVDNQTGQERGCICLKEMCARKCCAHGYGLRIKGLSCVNITEHFDPPVWDKYSYKHVKDKNATKLFHFVTGIPNCSVSDVRIRAGQATEKYHLRIVGDELYFKAKPQCRCSIQNYFQSRVIYSNITFD